MTSTKEYIKIFDGGVDFAVHSINEQCHTDFKSLADVIVGIRAMKDAQKAKQAVWVPLHADPLEWNIGGHLND
jgi:hypothetical protein